MNQNTTTFRIAGAALISSLMLIGVTAAQQPQRRQAAPHAKAIDPAQTAIEKKLDTIITPSVDFKSSSLEEAVDSLRTWSKELDETTDDPAQKGVKFMIRAPRTYASGRVRMSLEKMTLRKALENITVATGTRFEVDAIGVTVIPKDASVAAAPKPGDATALTTAAKKVTIPLVNFENTSLEDAVAFMNQQLKEHSQGEPAFTVSIDTTKVDNSTLVPELRLKNATSLEALKYLADATHTMLTAGEKQIWITRR